MMNIEPNVPYIEKVYASLKKAIVFNNLKPGEVLNERDLSERLNVSRTPLSNALNFLDKEGWIKKRGKSRVVAELHWKDIEEIHEMRLLTECFAVRKAVEKATPTTVAKMRLMLEKMEDDYRSTKNIISFLERDKEFHMFIGFLADNSRLNSFRSYLHEQFVRISFNTVTRDSIRLYESMKEHRTICKSIAANDSEGAVTACEKHITIWFDYLKKNREKNTVKDNRMRSSAKA